MPDPYADDYDEMIRRHKADLAFRAAAAKAPGQIARDPNRLPNGRPAIPLPDPNLAETFIAGPIWDGLARIQRGPRVEHPGFAESLIPVWGYGKEAVADLQEGDYLGAGVNGALAASDVLPAEAIATDVVKVGGKLGSRTAWRKVRDELGELGWAQAGQPVHHWAIPQRARWAPDRIKNHPWNLKPMPNGEVHGRLHGSYLGKPRFNPFQRYWHGTPDWWKLLNASVAGHAVNAIDEDQ